MAENSTHSLLFPILFFCGTRSLHHRFRLRKRFIEWNWFLCGSALVNHPSPVQSPFSIQRFKTVQFLKQLEYVWCFSCTCFIKLHNLLSNSQRLWSKNNKQSSQENLSCLLHNYQLKRPQREFSCLSHGTLQGNDCKL